MVAIAEYILVIVLLVLFMGTPDLHDKIVASYGNECNELKDKS